MPNRLTRDDRQAQNVWRKSHRTHKRSRQRRPNSWSRLDQHHFDWELVGIAGIFFLLGLWLASGSVSTTQTSITKRILWRSLSFRWDQVTEVRLHKRDGGAIELRAGTRKLIVDSRFVAFEHLLNEIQNRTQLQLTRAA